MKFDAGDYYYDTRYDKPLVIISADSDNITYQYVDPKKKQLVPIPNQKQHVLDNESASYFVSKGAWGKWKQKFNFSEQKMSNIKVIENYVKKIIKESDETYEGWTNFDTWAVAAYIDNEQPLYNLIQKYKGKLTVDGLQKTFEMLKRYNREGYAEVNKKNVNWQEIVDEKNAS